MNNTSKKIAATCLALAMVASVGAADVAGVLPVVNTVSASAESSNKLADGEYYVNVTQYNDIRKTVKSNNSIFLSRAKLKVENGKYRITVDCDLSSYKGDDFTPFFAEKITDNKISSVTSTNLGYALGLLPEDFDLENSPFNDKNITHDYDDMFEKIDVEKTGVKKLAFSFDVNADTYTVYLNSLLYKKDGETESGIGVNGVLDLDLDHAYQLPENLFSDFDQEVSYNYEELLTGSGYVTKGFKKTTAHAKAKDGKLYVTYYYDCDAVKNQCNENVIGVRLLDKGGNVINIGDDKTFTIVYNSIDEVINGIPVTAELNIYKRKKVNGEWKKVPTITNINEVFKLDFAVSPVTLTDPTTGVSILTTTKYVSKNAALMSTAVAEDSDAYKAMLSHCESIYNTMSYRQYYVVDNGKIVTDLGTLIMEFPVTEKMNKHGLGIFRSAYVPDYEDWDWQMFGAEDTTGYNGYIVGDKYMFIGKLSITDYIGFYDSKSTDTNGENLEDGTYEVPIAIFNVSSPSSTSMSQGCVGTSAKLIVKDGKKRLELGFKPVQDNNLTGYVIQMWYYDKNNDMNEVKYTSYYKNEDGTYYTDELNQGTNNYYPKTAYIELPTDEGQFTTKFRVSAMDAIMGNSGDATRNGLFTIYYDQAKKISDETPDPDPIEDPDFEPADMKALTDLVAKAEQYKEDDYTSSTYTTMRNALASAKTVLANSRATQEEVDSAVKELQTAIDALEEKKDVTFDINNLPDGKYQLYAQMIKTDRESFSMSNEGINHTVQLEVKDGEYYLTVQFKGLAIYNQFGYLQKLSYYDKGYTYNDYGIPQGTVIPAEVLTQYDIVDRYNDKDNLYPQLLKFKLVDKASEKYVPLQVFVPIMEAIADGTGTQDVLMQLDWTTLKATDADIDIEEPDAQSPVLDYTDSATGVKIHADKGVFAEGTTAVVKEITSGDDYDNAKKLISAEADKFHLYDVSFKGEDGKDAQPNGKFTISLPIPSDYANPVVYRIADGKKTLISGTKADGMFTFSAKEAGQYLIEDKKSAGSNSDNKTADSKTTNTAGSANPSTGAAAKTGLLAAIGAAFAVATKKRKER